MTLLHLSNAQCVGVSSTVVNVILQISTILLPLKLEIISCSFNFECCFSYRCLVMNEVKKDGILSREAQLNICKFNFIYCFTVVVVKSIMKFSLFILS